MAEERARDRGCSRNFQIFLWLFLDFDILFIIRGSLSEQENKHRQRVFLSATQCIPRTLKIDQCFDMKIKSNLS